MEYLRLAPDIDSDPDIERAGWVGARVFELLLKVSALKDLQGRIPRQYQQPEWLARRWNLTPSDIPGLRPVDIVTAGLNKLLEVELVAFDADGLLCIRGWDKFYKPAKTNAQRQADFRERHKVTEPVTLSEPQQTVTESNDSNGNNESNATPHHSTPLHIKKETDMSSAPDGASTDLVPEKPKRRRKPPTLPEPTPEAREVFEHWRTVFKKPNAQLDANRAKAVQTQLDAGRSPQELKRAVDGCAASAWHRGQNDRGKEYTDLALICRDAKHVEEFAAMAEARAPPAAAAGPPCAKCGQPGKYATWGGVRVCADCCHAVGTLGLESEAAVREWISAESAA